MVASAALDPPILKTDRTGSTLRARDVDGNGSTCRPTCLSWSLQAPNHLGLIGPGEARVSSSAPEPFTELYSVEPQDRQCNGGPGRDTA